MNEDRIERWVERMTDMADRDYMAGRMDDEQYNVRCAEIDGWAKEEYRKLAAAKAASNLLGWEAHEK